MLKKYNDLLNLDATIAKDLFERVEHPWEVLPLIKNYILELIPNLGDEYKEISENVFVHESVKIADTAVINGPTIICKDTEVRPGAFIRGSVIVGEKCVVGNSTEMKNAIIFNNCQCPHYNYVGDSVLGEKAHTGAGVILSNFKSDGSNVKIRTNDEVIETGLRKFGAILGNHADIGCNSVLFPGTIIGQNTNVYPLTRVRGEILPNRIVKDTDIIVEKENL
ncbi:MAG: UDP-N-acetylglucosamine pyrophosphorylase [Bacilli bacterium]|nr:UDP-N-acetylglucosamine pyrophosphorylase [Bacilli bacterium]